MHGITNIINNIHTLNIFTLRHTSPPQKNLIDIYKKETALLKGEYTEHKQTSSEI